MGELTVGGPGNKWLAEGWKTQGGYYGGPCSNAMWMGELPATDEDLHRLTSLGHRPDELTLCGLFDAAWSAQAYEGADLSDCTDPWDYHPKPGGIWSRTYQLQLIPDGIDGAMQPGKWLHHAGYANRSFGGEPFHYVDMGQGHIDAHLGGAPGTDAEGIIDWIWNDERKLFELIPMDQPGREQRRNRMLNRLRERRE